MAKYEADLKGNLESIISDVEARVKSSFSATCEEQSDFTVGDTRIAVRAYERYSMIGNNRVSLNITYAECEENIHVTAISTGGSQAIFFKFNTFGEESFLDSVTAVFEKYR